MNIAPHYFTLGLASLKNDPEALGQLMKDLQDPGTMAEVQKLMNDPTFRGQLDSMLKDPVAVAQMEAAKALFESPEKAARLVGDMREQFVARASAAAAADPISDVELGISELKKVANNPKALAEALESLKDPEIQREVELMMKDPAFIAEMQQYTNSPAFRKTMDRVSDQMEQLAADPVKLKTLEKQMKGLIGGEL
jgi:hypothetical protein